MEGNGGHDTTTGPSRLPKNIKRLNFQKLCSSGCVSGRTCHMDQEIGEKNGPTYRKLLLIINLNHFQTVNITHNEILYFTGGYSKKGFIAVKMTDIDS